MLCFQESVEEGFLQHLGHDVDKTGELGVTHGYTHPSSFSMFCTHQLLFWLLLSV